ncbi:MAG: thymidine kinase [Chloroflexi bacterium UTCFX4]|nr:MAG: thymidine kinase [Chloroflexi bacterium UTCFX4]
MDHQPERRGHVELVCGSMFSGKSEELIRRVRRAQIARQNVMVFANQIDVRYGEAQIASHNGSNLQALPIQRAADIWKYWNESVNVVAIDEAQFFDWEIAKVVEELARRGVRVIVAGLDTDFRGEPFGPMPILMAQAEEVTKLNAICMVCGGIASRTQRLVNGEPAAYDDPLVVVGANEMYEARCRHHHQAPRRA